MAAINGGGVDSFVGDDATLEVGEISLQAGAKMRRTAIALPVKNRPEFIVSLLHSSKKVGELNEALGLVLHTNATSLSG